MGEIFFKLSVFLSTMRFFLEFLNFEYDLFYKMFFVTGLLAFMLPLAVFFFSLLPFPPPVPLAFLFPSQIFIFMLQIKLFFFFKDNLASYLDFVLLILKLNSFFILVGVKLTIFFS